MLARERQRLFEIFGANHLEHGAEDFLLISLHHRCHMIKQRRPDEEALLMALQLEAAAIDDQFRKDAGRP
jgi:hypothetical protein